MTKQVNESIAHLSKLVKVIYHEIKFNNPTKLLLLYNEWGKGAQNEKKRKKIKRAKAFAECICWAFC